MGTFGAISLCKGVGGGRRGVSWLVRLCCGGGTKFDGIRMYIKCSFHLHPYMLLLVPHCINPFEECNAVLRIMKS